MYSRKLPVRYVMGQRIIRNITTITDCRHKMVVIWLLETPFPLHGFRSVVILFDKGAAVCFVLLEN